MSYFLKQQKGKEQIIRRTSNQFPNITVLGYKNQEKLYGSSKVQLQKYSRQLLRTYLILSHLKNYFSYLASALLVGGQTRISALQQQ